MKARKYWLLGARVWAQWFAVAPHFELYDFQGLQNGVCVFRNRKTKVTIAYTIEMIKANKTFRPFCYNLDQMGSGYYVTWEL